MAEAAGQGTAVDGDWKIRNIERVVLESDHYVEKKAAGEEWKAVKLGDWKDVLGTDFSGTAEYRITFQAAGQVIDLGDVAGVAEVWLNGQRLGEKAWKPYRFATGGALKAGDNELRVRVTNTLANYLVSDAVRKDWGSRTGAGWPGVYDGRANAFEKLSTRSGLFGPVRVVGN
jgi:hypothetical protein